MTVVAGRLRKGESTVNMTGMSAGSCTRAMAVGTDHTRDCQMFAMGGTQRGGRGAVTGTAGAGGGVIPIGGDDRCIWRSAVGVTIDRTSAVSIA